MDKKIIGITLTYAIIMMSLILVTFIGEWNPSGYSYSLSNETLTIEKGLFSKETTEIAIEDRIDQAISFSLSISEENQQWRMDVIVIGLLLPFLLLLFVPDRRPFKKQLSYPWFAVIVAALVVLYASYSVPAHITEISDIQNQVDTLVQE
ncbi:hypothetical protein [Halobacillus sp. B29]|uniref:hypothetical protein n=1 Tax=Halobacillus sp. B29 TaxID=3457432 RepID=UPI003FCCDB7C